jgi:hypothetical protein
MLTFFKLWSYLVFGGFYTTRKTVIFCRRVFRLEAEPCSEASSWLKPTPTKEGVCIYVEVIAKKAPHILEITLFLPAQIRVQQALNDQR